VIHFIVGSEPRGEQQPKTKALLLLMEALQADYYDTDLEAWLAEPLEAWEVPEASNTAQDGCTIVRHDDKQSKLEFSKIKEVSPHELSRLPFPASMKALTCTQLNANDDTIDEAAVSALTVSNVSFLNSSSDESSPSISLVTFSDGETWTPQICVPIASDDSRRPTLLQKDALQILHDLDLDRNSPFGETFLLVVTQKEWHEQDRERVAYFLKEYITGSWEWACGICPLHCPVEYEALDRASFHWDFTEVIRRGRVLLSHHSHSVQAPVGMMDSLAECILRRDEISRS